MTECEHREKIEFGSRHSFFQSVSGAYTRKEGNLHGKELYSLQLKVAKVVSPTPTVLTLLVTRKSSRDTTNPRLEQSHIFTVTQVVHH